MNILKSNLKLKPLISQILKPKPKISRFQNKRLFNFTTLVKTDENTEMDLEKDKSLFNLLEEDPTNDRYKSALKVISSIQMQWNFEMSQGNYSIKPEIFDYIKKHGYVWVEEPRNAESIFQKTTGEFLVELKFNMQCRPQVEEPDPYEEMMEGANRDKMMPHEKEFYDSIMERKRFNEKLKEEAPQAPGTQELVKMEITNTKTGAMLYFLVFTTDGNVRFSHVRLFSSESLAKGFEGLRLFSDPKLYKGVNFHSLSEGLQKAFLKFIEALDIQPEIFYHIEWLAYNREQRLYLELLKNIYQFAKKDLLTLKEENNH